MTNPFSRFVELGPLHGTLAIISKVTRSNALETALLRWLGRPFVRSRYCVKMRSNWSDVTFNLCYFGSYGRTLSDLLKGETRPFIFLDIGANQGVYSLIAGKNPRCRAAIAFEPVPSTFALLEDNVTANGLKGIVKPVNRAIAAREGATVIRIDQAHSGGATMASANPVAGDEVTIRMIDHRLLDELIPDGPEKIVVKIDVEGFERVVVEQLVKSRHVGRIAALFYEIDEAWVDPHSIAQTLRRVGLTVFRKISASPAATHYDILATR